jgi:hypothetical protein
MKVRTVKLSQLANTPTLKIRASREIRKLGAELRPGDVLKALGGTYTITHLRDHPGPSEHRARVAYSGDWSMTVFDEDYYTVILLQEN